MVILSSLNNLKLQKMLLSREKNPQFNLWFSLSAVPIFTISSIKSDFNIKSSILILIFIPSNRMVFQAHIKCGDLAEAEEFIKRTLAMDHKNVKVSITD